MAFELMMTTQVRDWLHCPILLVNFGSIGRTDIAVCSPKSILMSSWWYGYLPGRH